MDVPRERSYIDPRSVPAIGLDASGPLQGRPREHGRRGPTRARGPRQAAIVLGLITCGSLAAFAWSEYHPTALTEAEAASRATTWSRPSEEGRATSGDGPSAGTRRCWRPGALADADAPMKPSHYRKAGPLGPEANASAPMPWCWATAASRRSGPIERSWRRPDDVLALRRMAAVLISESRWDDALEAADRLMKILRAP